MPKSIIGDVVEIKVPALAKLRAKRGYIDVLLPVGEYKIAEQKSIDGEPYNFLLRVEATDKDNLVYGKSIWIESNNLIGAMLGIS